jgi:hypothetical protein
MNKNFLHSSLFSLLSSFFILTFATSAAFAQSVANPFTTSPGTRWQGRINYKDADGEKHSDLYEIVFVANGTCIVSVRTKENGEELFQDGDGLWSYDDNFLRVECDFADSAIERLPSINWVSVYQFDTALNRFTMLVPPYPGAKNNVRLQMIKTED